MPPLLGPQPSDRGAIYRIELADAAGAPILGTFTGADVLLFELWAGDDTPVLATPTATWVDAGLGTLDLLVTPADLLGLEPGVYRLRGAVHPGPAAWPIFDGAIRVAAAPGSGAALATYGSAEDLRRYASWVDDLQTDQDRAGFLEQRAAARAWLDAILLARYRPGQHGTGIPRDDDFWWGDRGEDPGPSEWLRGVLDGGGLIVDAGVREATARHALALIAEPMLGEAAAGTSYQQLAAFHRRRARALAASLRCRIDADGDGRVDLVVNLASSSVRR